jgi:hypothetical protein
MSSPRAVSISTGKALLARISRKVSRRHRDVEHGDVEVARERAACAAEAVVRRPDGEVLARQVLAQHGAELGVVVDDQDALHGPFTGW